MSLVDTENGQPLPPSSSQKLGYGLGIMSTDAPVIGLIWGHGGATLGYLSSMLWFKNDDVVMTSIINQRDNLSSTQEVLLLAIMNHIRQTSQQPEPTVRLAENIKKTPLILGVSIITLKGPFRHHAKAPTPSSC